jgi:mRNA-degrading endonuclease RelE of RelBE toxin-antitoxin system
MAYEIQFSRDAERQLRQLTARDRKIVIEAIGEQLTHQPEVSTQHSKLMRENPLADWELRVGEYRVFYDVDSDQDITMILAVGVKSHNVLRIEGKETHL